MGVKDLWKLLEPAGRPVKLESLEGLVVGVGKCIVSMLSGKFLAIRDYECNCIAQM